MNFDRGGTVDQVVPKICIKLAIGGYGKEVIIKDTVILGADRAGGRIEHKMDRRGVVTTNTKVNTALASKRPFRDSHIVLKMGI